MATVTNEQFLKKFGMPGTPAALKNLVLWDVPEVLEIGVIPKKIYCNVAMITPLSQGFQNLITRGFVNELKTWDGCYNLRAIRGYERNWKNTKNVRWLSVHAFGCAFDVNAAWNALGAKPTLSAGFVKCFTDAAFEWGGKWARKDGMHFQLAAI